MEELNRLRWFKSSYSGGGGGQGGAGCVETAAIGAQRAVRDSTDPGGSAFVFPTASWDAFIGGVKRGEFDLSA